MSFVFPKFKFDRNYKTGHSNIYKLDIRLYGVLYQAKLNICRVGTYLF